MPDWNVVYFPRKNKAQDLDNSLVLKCFHLLAFLLPKLNAFINNTLDKHQLLYL